MVVFAGRKVGASQAEAPEKRPFPFVESRAGLGNEQFAKWFRLFLSAVSHEVGNSLPVFTLLAENRKGGSEALVQGILDDYNRLRLLGDLAARPADARMARDFETLFPTFPYDVQGLEEEALRPQIRYLGTVSVRRLRSSLLEAGSLFRDDAITQEDIRFHFDRVIAYGGMLCHALEKLFLDDFNFSSEYFPQKALGRGSVMNSCIKGAKEAAIDVTFCEIDAGLTGACVVSNPLFLRLIIANVYSNAKRACEIAGAERLVRIIITPGEGTVCFCFMDQGSGMDYDTIKKLNAGVPVTTRNGEGHGIGFSYCRDIAEKLGGKLYIEYSEPGKGTTVVLELKVSE